MPQTFQVLRCYKCLVFQVHQTKKSIKWECKLCGEKQSIKRHYGIGTGKDCRVHVQKLNSLRGEIDELKCSQMKRNVESDLGSDLEDEIQNIQPVTSQMKLAKSSKWSNYVDEPEVLEESREPMCLGDAEVVLEIPKKRRKQFQRCSNNSTRNRCYAKAENNIPQDDQCDIKEMVDPCYRAPELKIQNSVTTPHNRDEPIVVKSPIKEKENFKPKAPIKKFVPPVINKNSKWAQFADEEEQEETLSSGISASQSNLKFALCDDGDLDSVLDL